MAVVVGADKLARKFKRMAEKSATKAARSGKRAELKVLSKAMKAAVNSSSAPAHIKYQARQSIGTSMKKPKGSPKGTVGARAGFGVGFTAKKRVGRQAKAKERAAGTILTAVASGGVGLSPGNIHWFVLGTKKRNVGTRTVGRGVKARQVATKGKYRFGNRGAIQPLFKDVTKQAVSACKTEMLSAARAAIMQTLAKEAAKTS